MPDSTTDRLRDLESRARALEPGPAERSALTNAAVAHAEAFLASLETAPALWPDSGSAGALDRVPIGRDPIGLTAALAFLDRHVDRDGQNTMASGFFAYIPGGNLYHAALADYLAAVSNRYSGYILGSPGGVRVENQVLAWLASLVGYPGAAAGNLTSGGSIANLIAIVAAREAAELRARDTHRAVVYLTDQAHHCVAKGLRVAGLGDCVQRRVPVDARFRMVPAALDAAMAEDARAGRLPWLVVATAGTTDTGAVDPLDEVAGVAARNGAWFHVDAAYGGMFALCPQGREALRGIERSDSVVLDPHKGLFIPFGVGAVLVKDAAAVRAGFAFDAHYIPPEGRLIPEVSPSEQSPELTRPFRALRLWLPLQVLGTGPFEAALEEKLLLARYAHARLREVEGLEVGPEPDLSLFVFRPGPGRGGRDERTETLERALRVDGRVGISGTVVGGSRYLRLAVLSLRTHRDAVDRAVEVIREELARLDAPP